MISLIFTMFLGHSPQELTVGQLSARMLDLQRSLREGLLEGEQHSECSHPSGARYETTSRFEYMNDGTTGFLRVASHRFGELTAAGEKRGRLLEARETQWARGNLVRVEFTEPQNWPADFSDLAIATVGGYIDEVVPSSELWAKENLGIAGIFTPIDGFFLTLADLTTCEGRLGLRMKNRLERTDADGTSHAVFVLESENYGEVEATFARIGGAWYAVRIVSRRETADWFGPPGVLGQQHLVGNWKTFDYFGESVRGLDRYEVSFEFSYRLDEVARLQSIKRVDLRSRGAQSSVVTSLTNLTRNGLVPDKATSADFMTTIPDGCDAHVLNRKTGYENVAHTTMGGRVVKKINKEALATAETLEFTRSPNSRSDRGGLLAVLVVFAFAALVGWKSQRHRHVG